MKLKEVFHPFPEKMVMCADCMKKFPEGQLDIDNFSTPDYEEFCPFCGSSHIIDVDDND